MNCYIGELSVGSRSGQGDWVDGAQSSLAFVLWTSDEEGLHWPKVKQSLLVCRAATEPERGDALRKEGPFFEGGDNEQDFPSSCA